MSGDLGLAGADHAGDLVHPVRRLPGAAVDGLREADAVRARDEHPHAECHQQAGQHDRDQQLDERQPGLTRLKRPERAHHGSLGSMVRMFVPVKGGLPAGSVIFDLSTSAESWRASVWLLSA